MPRNYAILAPNSNPNSGMGANMLPGGVGASFRVWAPNAAAVSVNIQENHNEPLSVLSLTPDPSNSAYFSADIGGVVIGDEYRFSITNNGVGPDNPGGIFERVDPYARDVRSSAASAPAFVVQPSLPGSFADFNPSEPGNYLIYQFHVGSFVGLNDGAPVVNRIATFRQITTAVLQQIADMRFNAVQFLPTTQNPPKEPEGYAPTNYFAPDDDYGDPADLVDLVARCHGVGLAVIFDVVYNHASAENAQNRLLQFDGNTVNNGRGIYFSTRDNFGPVPDFDRPEVRSFFADNGKQCFCEYNADGIRFDSAHAIFGTLTGFPALQKMLCAIKFDFPSKFLIAEHNDPPFAINTLGFAASWDMSSADDFVSDLANGSLSTIVNHFETRGVPHAFNRIRYLLGSHDQIFANYVKKGDQIVTDKPNNRYFVERVGGVITGRNDWTARAKARMGWGANIAIPCTPMMFMGTECHHYGYWNENIDAFGEHRFDRSLLTDNIGREMIKCVTAANNTRLNNPSLRSEDFLITHFDDKNRILGFKRWNDAGNVTLTVINLSDNQWNDATYGVGLAGDFGGSWTEIFNSQDQDFGGWRDSGNVFAHLTPGTDGKIYMRMPKWATLIFVKE